MLSALVSKFQALAALRREVHRDLLTESDAVSDNTENALVYRSMIEPIDDELGRLVLSAAETPAAGTDHIRQKAEMVRVIISLGDETAALKLARSLADDVVHHI